MSSQAPIKRVTAPDIRARKGATPVVALTSYDARTAALADPHCDLILVGDSVGMVKHGFDSTVPVTLEMMILHGKAVMRAAKHALVVVDLPFGSYESSRERAFESAARVVQETGCGAVKVEGGAHTAETIAFLVARGIPVLAHVGLTPQAINVLGTFRARGRNVEEEELIAGDARAVAEAGAFAVVLEAMAEPLAARITRDIAVPTIGIGASAACDGQILVVDDMLGFTPRVPKFVKRYAELGAAAEAAIAAYAADVRDRSFPAAAHVYEIKKG